MGGKTLSSFLISVSGNTVHVFHLHLFAVGFFFGVHVSVMVADDIYMNL